MRAEIGPTEQLLPAQAQTFDDDVAFVDVSSGVVLVLGALAFLLNFVKFCYLAVGMAHLSGAVAEKANGGLPAGLWLDEMDRSEHEPREPFWHAFPNHLDGAAIAGCITMLCFLLT